MNKLEIVAFKAELHAIAEQCIAHKNNLSHVARIFEVDRKTIYNKMRKLLDATESGVDLSDPRYLWKPKGKFVKFYPNPDYDGRQTINDSNS